MSWIFLILGGLFEVAFTYCIGRANDAVGTEKYLWYLGFLIAVSISMGLLIKASKTLPLGTAYAVWSGIGAVGSVTMGILIFKEPATFMRLFFIATLIASIVGLKVVSASH
ncbi:DMT family transporter [Myroides indicus]|jgi:quaternary ammonium compound-resistance protein SugE|uniref:Guanidinium exporter n=1 Tax=Myroides indicus TaxID=1323422 RepID=A0A4R7EYH7_9FLAO|nr:multidrug efflux SMR transporter [Myroides indicus]TDS61520.1 quaternary ammonium compound-resistance protein SugE [Myroides indicus]